MGRTAERVLAFGFVFAIFVVGLSLLVLPIRPFSELENRSLQRLPQLSWDTLWSKEFAKQAEAFVTDHFPLRGDWVWAKSELEQLRGQRENNGIYRGQDGYLFEKFKQPDAAAVQRYTEAVQKFARRHPEMGMAFMLAPTSAGFYPDRLPWLAPLFPQSEVNATIGNGLKNVNTLSYLNGFDFLHAQDGGDTRGESHPIFYRTDHHWTTYGAYLAYAAYARSQGWEPKPINCFQIETVSRSFLGSYHTRSQFSGVKPDSIQAYHPLKPVHSTMYIADTNETRASLYDASFLDKKDKYSYFLGGVHALAAITTKLPAADVDMQKLLILKDSYAHSVIPFLTLHVPELHVIDIRYYNGDIDAYMKENGITNVLMLFNTSTFVENNSLLKLNQSAGTAA
ncbi:DHHW family protein [Paenibacillus sp. MMS18-CY102]|uniref:DHHW family protein n=1 Tax=Paenibacillus sp. MMS18-CY102 TaxID=2682849 RepID=UPI0013658886|nr:DHHW family protein [Paenibacillus sp. MMS18-CY102]MWC27898.1 hypothetical protein [Paenibacillus sp. MMS18-CY102]